MALSTNTPSVSVLLPVYNAERYVGLAVESILAQTFKDLELIIIDDCSSDKSREILREYSRKDNRVRYEENEHNLGGCATLNKCLSRARGRYIARIDHDDWSYPDRLEKQAAFLDVHPDVGIVGGAMELMDENGAVHGKREYRLSDAEIRKNIFRYSPFSHPLVMMRKSVLDETGPYDPAYAPADDYELYFRIGECSRFANLPDTLLRYRVVAGSMTDRLTRKMELATIRVRRLYGDSAHYRMSLFDRAYNFLQYVSVFIVPAKIKIRVFNYFRNSKVGHER